MVCLISSSRVSYDCKNSSILWRDGRNCSYSVFDLHLECFLCFYTFSFYYYTLSLSLTPQLEAVTVTMIMLDVAQDRDAEVTLSLNAFTNSYSRPHFLPKVPSISFNAWCQKKKNPTWWNKPAERFSYCYCYFSCRR